MTRNSPVTPLATVRAYDPVVPPHQALRKLRSASGSVMAAVIAPRSAALNTAFADAPARDFESLRIAARLAQAGECEVVFSATSSETVKALDPTFAAALKKGVSVAGNRLGILIKCPVDPDEAVASLHFASLCAAQGAKLALELPEQLCATSWVIARAMAGGINACAVLMTGRTIVKMYGGRSARDARDLVASLVRPGAALFATAIDGLALQTLCERVGASGFEFGRAVPPAAHGGVFQPAKAVRGRVDRLVVLGLFAAGTLSLAACSSVPKPAVPDGSVRVPVNDPSRIALVEQNAQFQARALDERQQTRTEVASLQREVQQLRTAVKLLAIVSPLEAAKGVAAPATVARALPPVLGSAIALSPGADSRAVEATKEGLVFRVFHPTGGSNFSPAGKFAEALRAAAVSGAAIEVRSFTDSPIDDGANRRVSVARSSDARQWLVAQGVDPKLIKCQSTSHGHFLGDNGTSSGRSLNRRVEVEIRGDTTQAVAILNRKEG